MSSVHTGSDEPDSQSIEESQIQDFRSEKVSEDHHEYSEERGDDDNISEENKMQDMIRNDVHESPEFAQDYQSIQHVEDYHAQDDRHDDELEELTNDETNDSVHDTQGPLNQDSDDAFVEPCVDPEKAELHLAKEETIQESFQDEIHGISEFNKWDESRETHESNELDEQHSPGTVYDTQQERDDIDFANEDSFEETKIHEHVENDEGAENTESDEFVERVELAEHAEDAENELPKHTENTQNENELQAKAENTNDDAPLDSNDTNNGGNRTANAIHHKAHSFAESTGPLNRAAGKTEKKKATGIIISDSYFDSPKDKLVSRLVSNFESQMNNGQGQRPAERRIFSRGKINALNTSPVTPPATADEAAPTASNGATSTMRAESTTFKSDIQPIKIDAGKVKMVDIPAKKGRGMIVSGKREPPSVPTFLTEAKQWPNEDVKESSVDQSIAAADITKSIDASTHTSSEPFPEAVVTSPVMSEEVVSREIDTAAKTQDETSSITLDEGSDTQQLPSIRAPPSPKVELAPIIKEEPQGVADDTNIIFGVCVVGFHHSRGPEVEYWKGSEGDQSDLWPYLPFQSLPDGSHSQEESFCYFTLLYDTEKRISVNPTPQRDEEGHIIEESDFKSVVTLFGIACNRQIRAEQLKHSTADITRSIVQKSVVVIAKKPIFGPIKEKLALVTRAYFFQGDFDDRMIVDNLYDNLRQIFSVKLEEEDLAIGMPLRELLYRLGHNVLVLVKALLLEKRILFFASNTELLCASQFALVTLIPNLINHLEDCGSPLLSTYETKLKKPTSLRTSDRESLLAFMGLPLQIFAAGGIFSPYVPLQQLKELKADETKYYMIGSTNSLVLSPHYETMDIFVNMDQDTVEITNKELNSVLQLSAADKKWIDGLIDSVKSTWDAEDPWRPKDLGYIGSEDYIRQQFEDYFTFLLSSVKYDTFLSKFGASPPPLQARTNILGNPLKLYTIPWVEEWKRSNNYRIFNKFTDGELFDIVEPRHPGDVNSEMAQREGIGKTVTKVFGNLWARESQTKEEKGKEGREPSITPKESSSRTPSVTSRSASISVVSIHSFHSTADDQNSASDSIRPEGQRSRLSVVSDVSNTSNSKDSSAATAPGAATPGYFSSWSSWASNKRRNLFAKRAVAEEPNEEGRHSTEGSIKSIDLSRD